MPRLIIALAFLATSAHAAPFAVGDAVSGEVVDAAAPVEHTFDALPGQTVFVQRTASSNLTGLNWRLLDAYGRSLASNLTELGHLGPVTLMGGTYTLRVTSETTGVGTYAFTVHDATPSSAAIDAGVAVNGDIDVPGRLRRYVVPAKAGHGLLIDVTATSNSTGLNWWLEDSAGTDLVARGTSLADGPLLRLGDELVTLWIAGEGASTGTYAFVVHDVVDVTAPITVGSPVTASIAAGQARYYTFSLTNPSPIYVDVTAVVNAAGMNAAIIDAEGRSVVPLTTTLTDIDRLTLPAGDYTLAVASEGTASGSYTLVVRTPTDTTAAMTPGTAFSGAIAAQGGRATYTFSAAAGTHLLDVVASSNAGGIGWSLADAHGRTIIPLTTSLSDSARFGLMGGDYVLTLDGEVDATGTFTLNLLTVVDASSAITLGTTVSSSVAAPGQIVRHTFSVAAPTTATLDLITSAAAASLNWTLSSAAGRLLFAQTTALADRTGVLLAPGSYVLSVLGEGTATGAYSFALNATGTPGPVLAGTPVALGGAVSGTVDGTAEVDAYTLTLTDTRRVYFDLTTGTASTRWTLVDAAGAVLFGPATAQDPISQDGGAFWLDAGVYTLTFSRTTTGTSTYAATLADATPTVTALGFDTPVVNAITTPGMRHRYTLTVASATRALFDVRKAAATVRWTLTDGGGNVVISDVTHSDPIGADSGPIGLAPGTWTLEVRCTTDDSGSYDFAVVTVPADALATVALDTTIDSPSYAPGTTLRYTLPLADRATVYVDALISSSNLTWTFRDDEGNTVAVDGNLPATSGLGPFNLPAGDYTLTIDPDGSSTPAFRFEFVSAPTTTMTADLDVVLSLPVTRGQTRAATLTVPTATRFFADATTSVGGYYRLRRPGTSSLLLDAPSLYAGVNMNSSTSADRGPVWLAPGVWTLEFEGRDLAPTIGFVPRHARERATEPLPFDQLVKRSLPAPAGLLRYSVTVTDESITFDLLRNVADLRWRLIDPVGTPVFDAAASDGKAHDVGPLQLAPGTYLLELYSNLPITPEVLFEARTGQGAPGVGACASCRALDIVFVFDTSASMAAESTLVCDLAGDLVLGLQARGIETRARFLGVTDELTVPCVEDTVLNAYGGTLPSEIPSSYGTLGACTEGGNGNEDWALATAILAQRYDWAEGAVRLVIPVGDEGPYCGDPVDSHDQTIIGLTAAIASARGVIVSPIVPAGVVAAVHVLGEELAALTDGIHTASTFTEAELAETVVGVAGSACTTEDETIEPVVADFGPAGLLPPGPIILSGRVVPVNRLRPVVSVRINGEAVSSYDVSGRFFHSIALPPGDSNVTIELIEGCGAFTTARSVSVATETDGSFADFTILPPTLSAQFEGTSWALDDRRLLVDATVENVGTDPVDGPILMVLGTPLDPRIQLPLADGTTESGEPYFEVVPQGQSLDPNASALSRALVFEDPSEVRVLPGVRFFGRPNRAPYFTSAPVVRVASGATWRYSATALDPDGHTLTWTLPVAPVGMTVSQDGELVWTPGSFPAGSTVEVAVLVDDGRGASAVQRFSVTVGSSANSPPLFVSSPPLQLAIGAAYVYDARAGDVDGDTLTFTRVAGPAGLSVGTDGAVRWSFAVPGTHEIAVKVDDGQGGAAIQEWSLTVGTLAEDEHAPMITSIPPTVALPDVPYAYPVQAFDPDGDVLTWTLVSGPIGMAIDAQGKVTFTPSDVQLGPHTVTVRVADDAFGRATQTWTLLVTTEFPNLAPTITSTPPATCAVVGTEWTYAFSATDPEGVAVAYDASVAPPGLGIHAATGATSFTPTAGQVGAITLALTASDGALAATQVFNLDVRGTNTAPTFGAALTATIAAGTPWSDWARGTDADGDALTHRLLAGPAGMTIDPRSGRLTWTPTTAQAGPHAATVEARDLCGGVATTTATFTVTVDLTPPEAAINTAPYGAICQNGVTVVCLAATDAAGIASRALTVGGTPVTLDAQGCTLQTFAALGDVALAGTVRDPSGNETVVARTLTVEDCTDPERPVVTLVTPDTDTVHEQPVPLVVTISDNKPENLTWIVERAPAGSDVFVTIAEGVGPVDAAAVATFDPSVLPNEAWRVRIVASDGQQTGGIEMLLHSAGSLKLGQFRYTVLDLTLDFAGIPLTLSRTYDSLDANAGIAGDVGIGWTMSLGASVRDAVREAPEGSIFEFMRNEAMGPKARVVVTKPDGTRVGFTLKPEPLSFPQLFQQRVVWAPDRGVTDTLEAVGPKNIWATGKYYDFIIPYNPDTYILKTQEGMKYTISERRGLELITSPSGQTVTVTKTSIVSSTGGRLDFERDAQGRITAAIAPPDADSPIGDETPAARLVFAYDARGNLASMTDAGAAKTTYRYQAGLSWPNLLTAIEDPLGRPMRRLVYGPDGRHVATCGAEGNVATLDGCERFEHDLIGNMETVFTPRGARIERYYDDDGNLVTERLEASPSETIVVTAEYNDQGFLTSVTDGTGGTWSMTLDGQGRPLTQTDPLGNVWTTTWGACSEPVLGRDPLGNVRTFEFDSKCRVTRETTPTGAETRYERTADGEISAIIGPVGDTWTVARNELGQVVAQIDPLGRTATMAYRSTGEVKRRVEPSGRSISYVFDASGRPIKERWNTVPETAIETTYDPAGQITSVVTPAVTTVATYTNTGRLASVTSTRASGQTIALTYTYDASGNLLTQTDSLGGVTTYEYDGADRLLSATQTDGAGLARRIELEYDGAYRRTALHRYASVEGSKTPAGLASLVSSTHYVWNSAHRLIAMLHRDADDVPLLDLGFPRDAVGNIVSLTDALGTATVVVDGDRRVLAVDRPAGGGPDESYQLDPAGNRTSSHLSADYVHSYELTESGHELRSDDDFDYIYDPQGNLSAMTERTTGTTVRFETDHRGRTTRLTRENAEGAVDHEAVYTYDAFARRIAETVNGVRTEFVYSGHDAILRLLPDGSVDRRLYLGLDEVVADTAPPAGGGPARTRWYLLDHVNSTRMILDSAGAILAERRYDAFGQVLAATGEETTLEFAGRPFDGVLGTGDFRNRTMLPSLGRFAQMDPEAPYRYEYADNNPIAFTDPMGRNSLKEYALLVSRIALQLFKRHWKCVVSVVVIGAGGYVISEQIEEVHGFKVGAGLASLYLYASAMLPKWVAPVDAAADKIKDVSKRIVQRMCQ
ncbi:MAG: putative Ig domain-containing protein [Myxococcales bacterium]|nr:putative Ig domain-containing protein [Myxococcales bacterium]